jgi:hypothetical protein
MAVAEPVEATIKKVKWIPKQPRHIFISNPFILLKMEIEELVVDGLLVMKSSYRSDLSNFKQMISSLNNIPVI